MTSRILTHQDYTVGWVCALTTEMVAARLMLDELHGDLPYPPSDHNAYALGSIRGHHIAIACLPNGEIGNNSAATVATRMISTFPSIRFSLMVGIGGGMPPQVRLGDVVVSSPVYESPGVVQWDSAVLHGDGFRRIGALDRPPEVLRAAITRLQVSREIKGSDTRTLGILKEIKERLDFSESVKSQYLRCDHLEDNLFRSSYDHKDRSNNAVEGNEKEEEEEEEQEMENVSSCRYCDPAMVVRRQPRETKFKTHFGVIASGNSVIKNAKDKKRIKQQIGGDVLCFEMEAAGIMNSHPCLVIRGICGNPSLFFRSYFSHAFINRAGGSLTMLFRLRRHAQKLQVAEIRCDHGCCLRQRAFGIRCTRSGQCHAGSS